MAGTCSGLCSSNITTLPGWDTSPQHYAASICLLRVFTVPSFQEDHQDRALTVRTAIFSSQPWKAGGNKRIFLARLPKTRPTAPQENASLGILILVAGKYFLANQKQGFDHLLQLVMAPRSTINLVSRVKVFFFLQRFAREYSLPISCPCMGSQQMANPTCFSSSLKFPSYKNYELTRLRLSWSNGW